MTTKKCTKCGLEKDESFFSKKSNTKLHSYCKECHSKYRREHYLANKAKYIKKAHTRKVAERMKIAEKIAQIKSVPCTDCGKTFHHCAMDFDHVENNKVANVSRLALDSTWERVKQEIDKCEVVCSNCHRIRTWNRQQHHRLCSG